MKAPSISVADIPAKKRPLVLRILRDMEELRKEVTELNAFAKELELPENKGRRRNDGELLIDWVVDRMVTVQQSLHDKEELLKDVVTAIAKRKAHELNYGGQHYGHRTPPENRAMLYAMRGIIAE